METIFHINVKLQIKISRDAHSSCHFLLNTLKDTAITLLAVILYYSILSGTNRQILTPKRYDEHPRHFYRGVPPPIRLRDNRTSLFFQHSRKPFFVLTIKIGFRAEEQQQQQQQLTQNVKNRSWLEKLLHRKLQCVGYGVPHRKLQCTVYQLSGSVAKHNIVLSRCKD